MDPSKYSRIIQNLGNIREETAITLFDIVKLLFKKIILGDKEIQTIHELWFEKEEIKVDKEYYRLIQSLINIFTNHFSDQKSFKEKLLMEEIISLFRNTKYFCLYNYLIELSNLCVLEEKYYTEIFRSLYILGIKRGTPVNAILIDTLKDFTENDFIKQSKFYPQIKSIKYENINESFMKNILLLFKFIKSNEDEAKIKHQIIMLENHDYQSSVSTYVENNDNDDKNLSEAMKNSVNTSSIKEEQNSYNVKGTIPPIEEEKDPSENTNLSMDADIQKKEALYPQKTEKMQQTHDKDIINNKNPELDKIELENEKDKMKENEIKINGADIQNDNIEKSISDYSLDELLNYIKVKSEEFKDEAQDKDKDIEKNNYMTLNSTLAIIQMNNRFFLILQQLDKYKDTIKEIENSQSSQKIFAEHKIEIQKLLIEVNTMKSVVESLKIPSFVIVKRKLLDLIIFSLLKSNKDKFNIDKNYCLNKNIL